MTRGRTPAQKNADTAAHAGRAVLVELAFGAGTLRLAIAQRDLIAEAVWELLTDENGDILTDEDGNPLRGDLISGDTYSATGLAFAMQPVEESAAGFEGMELSLSGVDIAILDIMAAADYRGKIVRVFEARFDDDDDEVETAQVQWIGRIRAMGDETVTADGKTRVWLQAEHFDAEFDQPQPIRFTDADQQRRYPGDLGAEYLASLQDRVLSRDRKQ